MAFGFRRAVLVLAMCGCGCGLGLDTSSALMRLASQGLSVEGGDDHGTDEGRDGDEGCRFNDRDFYVSHVSTVPANAGQQVNLFVRERGDSCGPPVLMLTGATQPAMVPYDLPYADYSWMTYLANAGFDVFAMDLQGYGFSTRPEMDNPCNASQAAQTSLLIPNPLQTTCPPTYPFKLTTAQSEWDEVDSVVNQILAERHRKRISLVGWSAGGYRAGGYASQHPEKVRRLFLYAPFYDWTEPTDPPPVLPQPGTPLAISSVSAFFNRWSQQATCSNEFDRGIRTQLQTSLLQFDPLGATWGTQPLWRSPSFNPHYGWNPTTAAKVTAPTLLIRGDNDAQVPLVMVTNLYNDISSKSKVFVHVACAAHQMVWERQHTALLDASVQWLTEGNYAGERNGCFAVDVNGVATSCTPGEADDP